MPKYYGKSIGLPITWLDIPKDADGNSIYTGPYKNTPAGVKAFNKAVACSKDNRTITFQRIS